VHASSEDGVHRAVALVANPGDTCRPGHKVVLRSRYESARHSVTLIGEEVIVVQRQGDPGKTSSVRSRISS
jgi:hypothetical protein